MFEALHLMVECKPDVLAAYPSLSKFVTNFAARPQVPRAAVPMAAPCPVFVLGLCRFGVANRVPLPRGGVWHSTLGWRAPI